MVAFALTVESGNLADVGVGLASPAGLQLGSRLIPWADLTDFSVSRRPSLSGSGAAGMGIVAGVAASLVAGPVGIAGAAVLGGLVGGFGASNSAIVRHGRQWARVSGPDGWILVAQGWRESAIAALCADAARKETQVDVVTWSDVGQGLSDYVSSVPQVIARLIPPPKK